MLLYVQIQAQCCSFRLLLLVLVAVGGFASAVGNNAGSLLSAAKSSVQLTVPVSYLYVVGIEGVGHHGVTPALSVIAKSCGYHVDYEPRYLRHAQSKAQSQTFISYLSSIVNWSKTKTHGQDKVVVIEDQSFPMDKLKRNSTVDEKKGQIKYNIEWLYNQAQDGKADVRFFHLTRDFYRTVASHPEFDNGFQEHALVLKDFLEYIHLEKKIIDSKKPDLWRQIHYEWFTDMQNCTALVSAVIDFAGWNGCDVEFACEVLQKILRKGSNRTIDEADYAFAQSLNATIPVPELDISADREYAFDRVVSTRDWSRYDGELRSAKGLEYAPTRSGSARRPARPATARNATTIRHEAIATAARRAANPSASLEAAAGRNERFTRVPPASARSRDQRLNAVAGREVVRTASPSGRVTGGTVVAPRNPRTGGATPPPGGMVSSQPPIAPSRGSIQSNPTGSAAQTTGMADSATGSSRPVGSRAVGGPREWVHHSQPSALKDNRVTVGQVATGVRDTALYSGGLRGSVGHHNHPSPAAANTAVTAHRFAHDHSRHIQGQGQSHAAGDRREHRSSTILAQGQQVAPGTAARAGSGTGQEGHSSVPRQPGAVVRPGLRGTAGQAAGALTLSAVSAAVKSDHGGSPERERGVQPTAQRR